MDEPQQREPVVREVPYPEDAGLIARRLADSHTGWYWLDGGFDAVSSWTYLGVADEVRTARAGEEPAFLEMLRGMETPTARTGFFGGWVAALGYEFGVSLLGLEPASDDAAPAFALRVGTVLAIDHGSRRAELRGRDPESLERWWARYGSPGSPWSGGSDGSGGSDARGEEGHVARSAEHSGTGCPPDDAPGVVWRRTDAAYAAQVVECQRRIVDGDAYVLCLTDTAELRTGDVDPLDLYSRLRLGGGASRGAVIVAEDRALVSASPERFLSVAGRTVATHPIKGTRPRGADPASDRGLAAELAADPKERAENLMIVDLMRNDLSRVCEPGSVRVDGFLRVESHPHVHQLVSTVSGTLLDGLGAIDAVAAAFPGGSMTGAPKHRAVEILAALEAAPRGLYSGCFGWFDARGDAELAMTIRTIELRGLDSPAPRRRARIGAGGGVTADSDPAAELREKHLKAAPLLAAARLAARTPRG